ncbi:histidine-type phosphatase [Dyella sp. 2RAB6]|uniref:histidine-type phosphatase n=1 Tax=Dyella sp. 2RAB6 TaxID=3232992 RepID=UPI003F92B6B3
MPGGIVRVALLGAALLAPVVAQADEATLRLRIVVLRHGVRAPTKAPDALAPYANRPWAAWPVAPGQLTPHGIDGMRALGASYRRMFAVDGLWSGACDRAGELVVIADSTPRNHASGAALVQGLMPDCHGTYLALPTEQNNALFHVGGKDDDKDDDDKPALPATWPPAELAELQRVLLGCEGSNCLAQAHADGRKTLLDAADDTERAKALKTAGSLSENLMLEYAQGFPSAQVAWGQGDEAAIGRLVTMHNLQFALAKKTMPAAARGGSNLLAHVLATLQQAAGEKPQAASLAPASARAVLVVGHDTNLAQLAGLLDVDWHDAAHPDDYPPGGALVFDLWQAHGNVSVTVSTAMPTLDALRHADFAAADALVRKTLKLAPCPGSDRCPLDQVSRWLRTRMDATRIDPALPALRAWPAASQEAPHEPAVSKPATAVPQAKG